MNNLSSKFIRYFNNTWVKWFLIPGILFLVWFVLSLFFNSYISAATLTQDYNESSFTQKPPEKLLQDKSVSGEFSATDNNLGVISIGFIASEKKVSYDDEDILVFKIKEKGQNQWWSIGKYRSGAITTMPLYPFGLPVISNSKGKTYQFSITSLHGNKQNAVSLSRHEPMLVVWYVYPKHELLSNQKLFFTFLYQKIVTSFTDINFLRASINYSVPFVLYLFALIVFTKMRIDRYSFLFVIPILILFSVLWNIDKEIGLFFELIGFWIITIIIYKAESSISFLFALFFFVFSFFSVFIGYQGLGGRFSNWTYIFLVIGTIQLLWEAKKPSSKRLSYQVLLSSVFRKNKNKRAK